MLAALACARAEVALVAVTPQVSTPLPPADTPTPAASNTLAPTPTLAATATEAAYPGPTEAGAVTSTAEALPTEAASATVEAASPTPEPASTETPTLPAPSGGGFPADATVIQNFKITFQAGILAGRAEDMLDGQTSTWASLRAGSAFWIFDLGSAQHVVGVRLVPHADGNERVTLVLIEVSADGTEWTPVYTGQGECGVPNCDTLPLDTTVDLGFASTSAQFVRLQAGPAPARFAFAEVGVAVGP
jgi:hypothetical protein